MVKKRQPWRQTVWSQHLNLSEGKVQPFHISASLAATQSKGLAAPRMKGAGAGERRHSGHTARAQGTKSRDSGDDEVKVHATRTSTPASALHSHSMAKNGR